MSQKEAPVLPRKVAKIVRILIQFRFEENDHCFLDASWVLPGCFLGASLTYRIIKFLFLKKATKLDKIFTKDLTFTT